MVARRVWGPPRVPEALAFIVPPKEDRGWPDGVCTQGSTEAPAEKELRRVGRDLDPRAHLAQHMRTIERRDAVPVMWECVGRGEATNARADDDDVEVEGGAATIVEGRHLFERNVWE